MGTGSYCVYTQVHTPSYIHTYTLCGAGFHIEIAPLDWYWFSVGDVFSFFPHFWLPLVPGVQQRVDDARCRFPRRFWLVGSVLIYKRSSLLLPAITIPAWYICFSRRDERERFLHKNILGAKSLRVRPADRKTQPEQKKEVQHVEELWFLSIA